jgi:hypothetical protein
MLQASISSVSNVLYYKCFYIDVAKGSILPSILQVFYIDVTKVDRDIVHIAIVFSSVCLKCFISFRRMLQLFIWIL